MSGSSALASARRRRTEPVQQVIEPQNNSSKVNQETKNPNNLTSTATSTPLQILQMHDRKIKELEDNLEENIINIAKRVVLENLNLQKESVKVQEFDSKPLLLKIDTLESNFSELKMLIIKTQQTSLDTTNEMLKIKDKIKSVEENIEENILQIQNEIKQKDTNEENIFNMSGDNAAEMLLRSMMQSTMMEDNEIDDKINIHDEEDENESSNIGDINEITLSESELNSIKSEVVTELKEELVNIDDFKNKELINVSENESDKEE